MAHIELRSACVSFPIYNVNARSFKNKFLRMATGGLVVEDANQHVVVDALKNINLRIEHGDRIGLVGHNGCGKSTLLRLLATIYEPTSGEVIIDGNISPMLNLAQGIEAEFTGYENITLRGTLLGLTKKEIEQQSTEIAELTGLGDYLHMPIRTYSSGMMVRLAFAISACLQPEILLIDEVFGAGDADFMKKARERMTHLLDTSSIVIMANHSDDVIREFCTKVIVLESGHLKYFGDVETGLNIYHQT